MQALLTPRRCMQVYKQRELPNEAVLEQAGISGSDPLVLLEARPLQKPQGARITPVSSVACCGCSDITRRCAVGRGLPCGTDQKHKVSHALVRSSDVQKCIGPSVGPGVSSNKRDQPRLTAWRQVTTQLKRAGMLLATCHLLATMQSPDATTIRAAITEEARRRGIEHTLKEERHPTAQQRRNMALPRQLLSSLGGVDDQLVQLLEQALDGQFNLANLRLGGGGGDPHAEEEVGFRHH